MLTCSTASPARLASILRLGAERSHHALVQKLRGKPAQWQAQAAGFTLEEIRELIALDRTHDRDRIRAIAAGKLAKLRAHIAELRAAGRALEGLVHECEHGRKGTPCPLTTAFDTAAHPRGRAGHC